jgi:hypothetical protein
MNMLHIQGIHFQSDFLDWNASIVPGQTIIAASSGLLLNDGKTTMASSQGTYSSAHIVHVL